MKLIIDIPEEQYNIIKSNLYNTFSAEMKEWGLKAIRNGTPFPICDDAEVVDRKCSKCVNANNPVVCSWNIKDIAKEEGCDFWQDSSVKMESEVSNADSN